ncbi:hypothetical protein MD588_24120 [Photobacterium sp. SDRW27]|uniref:hypothetical protein n=1 Tax=Photobacterium obscurum TaxID=2829490 RepID=UPI0022447F2A|nr:hypothetical protein [Photobacterium obscurum]MCW8331890.1 hypothetical protein [Photobacterium obscurum]
MGLVRDFSHQSCPVNIVQQEFIGEMAGRSSVLYGGNTFTSLMEYLGYDEEDSQSTAIQREILNELTNVINSTSLSGLSNELDLDIHLAQPAILEFESQGEQLDESQLASSLSDERVLLIDIKLEIAEKGVRCDSIISMKEEGLVNLVMSLRKLMA